MNLNEMADYHTILVLHNSFKLFDSDKLTWVTSYCKILYSFNIMFLNEAYW